MTELMTRVLNAIPTDYAVRAHSICDDTDAERDAVLHALFDLQNADLVFMRNGFYRLSEKAKAARAPAGFEVDQ